MSGLAYAQSAPPPTTPPAAPGAPTASAVSKVVVTGSRVRSLEQFTPTGSRLNLSAKDIPATLDVVTSQTIATRGYLTAEEAADSLTGVTSGGTPGDLVNFHIRGFSADEIQILHNGIYVGPSDLITRPTNTYNLDSVQVLKGPASVLYGQGAIGGAINIVNKAVTFGDPEGEVLFSYGDFSTSQEAASVDGSITHDLAARLDISYLRSDNYIRNAPSPRRDLIDQLGEDNQSVPVLVLAEGETVKDAGIIPQTAGKARFFADERLIRRYLSAQYKLPQAG